MELIGALFRASSVGNPIARKLVKVEENESPAPVLSIGGAGSG